VGGHTIKLPGGLIPGRTVCDNHWTWGPEVAKLPKVRKSRLRDVIIQVDVIGTSPHFKIPMFRLVSPGKRDTKFKLDDVSYRQLWSMVRVRCKISKSNMTYYLAYLNTFRSKESLRIHNDVTLRVAIQNLYIRDSKTLRFRVSLIKPPHNKYLANFNS
jgi:hypothetical protein